MNPNRSFILCATDFSAPAADAANVAARIAARRGETLRLVHVSGDSRISMLAAMKNRLEVEAERLRRLGADVTPTLLKNGGAAGLLATMKKESPGLIVV